MVPPYCGWGCSMSAMGALGRFLCWYRPSSRPSGPLKITSGIDCSSYRSVIGLRREARKTFPFGRGRRAAAALPQTCPNYSGLLYLTVLQVLGSGCRCWGAHHLRGCRPRPRGVEKGGDTSTTGEAMFKSLQAEIDATMQRDPAARSRLEVVLCYPGFQAVILYRLSNAFWRRGWFLVGRWISAVARLLTGIEIHPGATIGRRFFVDHGMGVVIGETAEIGDDVTLYQGVTLGGTSPSVDSDSQRNVKRHPQLKRSEE